jgi:signal transduction histidine kinase
MGRDITESKQAKEELEKANKQLREIDKLKDNFLSTVSHELRTPLTSIKSFVEILLNYDEDKTTQKEFLGIINEESDRLTRLINDFLDISKIQAGRMQWKTEELSVTDAINSAVNTARPLIDKEKLTVTVNAEADLPKVLCDRDRLVQVVTNILGNAIKFTPESGKITLKAWFDKNQSLEPAAVTVSITDTGIGIAPENHHKIFENFGQVGDVLKDRPKGTGLGLPICKKIIENYKGKIWVDSDLGKGTTFLFTLPVAKPKDNCRSQI